jgi:uncharacterized membrane protein YfcA
MLPLLVAVAIMLVAATAQALTGFGYSLVSVPLLSLVIGPHAAVVSAAVASLSLNVGTVVVERAHVRRRATAVLVAAGALGTPLGLFLLHELSDNALRILIAVVVLLCTVQVWRGFRVPEHRSVVIAAGLLSGTLGTSTGTNGPPLVAAFQAMGYEPRQFRATLAAIFCFTGVIALVGFGVTGQFTRPAVTVGLWGTPAVALGWLVGNRLFATIDAVRFRQVVLVALVATSVVTAIRALSG